MTNMLARRLGRLERVVEETQRRPMRERILRICDRLGADLPAVEVEALVSLHAGTPARITHLRRDGWSDDQILEWLSHEAAIRAAR
jgi:hypothetical protein